tara:strand:+ start:42 stop:584 length:543 start_codon:yes stop_codon:yes gene_type:complete
METQEIVKIIVATIKELNGEESTKKDNVPSHVEALLESLSNSTSKIFFQLNELQNKLIKLEQGSKEPKRKKRTKSRDNRKVTIVKNIDSQAFGVRTHTVTNNAIERALHSKKCRFSAPEIIAEVKRKHPITREWSGKELLRQIKLAKGRLDCNRRRKEGVGQYSHKGLSTLEFDLPKNEK